MSEDNDDRNQVEDDAKEDLDLPDKEAGQVGGSLRAPSPPAGPIPIPYPVVGASSES